VTLRDGPEAGPFSGHFGRPECQVPGVQEKRLGTTPLLDEQGSRIEMAKRFKVIGAVAVAGLIAGGGSASTAANTVPGSDAGGGSTVVNGYTTTGIRYQQNAAAPQNLDSVTFTLDHAATYLAVRTHAGGTWYTNEDLRLNTGADDSCTSLNDAGIVWTCDVTANSETVAIATTLDVVASG
jgi:hypothetical protein